MKFRKVLDAEGRAMIYPVQEALDDLADLQALREAKAREGSAPTRPLAAIAKEMGL